MFGRIDSTGRRTSPYRFKIGRRHGFSLALAFISLCSVMHEARRAPSTAPKPSLRQKPRIGNGSARLAVLKRIGTRRRPATKLGIRCRETLHSAFSPLRIQRQSPEGVRLFSDGVILCATI